MGNEELAKLIKNAKNRIYELNCEMKKFHKDVCDLSECIENAHRDSNYEDAGNAAHDLANVYMKMQDYKNWIAYFEKQIAKHQ